MPGAKSATAGLEESIDLQHWTDSLGSPLLIFIFVLIAAHLLAFVRTALNAHRSINRPCK